MSKLHHKSTRYELQEWRDHTLSWKPIAHTNNVDEAKQKAKAHYERTGKKNRILDRVNGADKATVLLNNY